MDKPPPFQPINSNFPRTAPIFGIVAASRNVEKLYFELDAALAECRRSRKNVINKKKDPKKRPVSDSPWWLLSAILGFNPGGGSPPEPPPRPRE
jgi:hypothetical protein